MINIVARPLFFLIIMCYFSTGFFNCFASDENEEGKKYERLISRKKLSSSISLEMIEFKSRDQKILSSQGQDKFNFDVNILMNPIELQETSLELIRDFPPKIRTERKTPPLNLTFVNKEFNWLNSSNYDDKIPPLFLAGIFSLNYIYGQKLILSHSEDFDSLGNMMNYFHKTGIQEEAAGILFQFKYLECLFACTYQEIISYKKLYYSKQRILDTSKIGSIKKAMCFYKVPVILALSLANNSEDTCCKILILYGFNDNRQQFKAKEIPSNNKIIIPYLTVQILALEAWVGYNSIAHINFKP